MPRKPERRTTSARGLAVQFLVENADRLNVFREALQADKGMGV